MQWPRYKMPDISPHSPQWRPRLVRESPRPGTDVKRLPKRPRCIVIFTLASRVFDLHHFNPYRHPVPKPLVKESPRPETDVKSFPKKGLARCIVTFTLANRVFNLRHFNPFRRPVPKPLVTESPRPATDVKTFSKRGVQTGIVISTTTNNCFDLRHFNSHYRRISTSQNTSCTPSRALNMLSKNLAALGSNLSQAITWKE